MRVLCRRTNKEYTKYCLAYSLFQSPSSVWRTTLYRRCAVLRGRDISIHVLRVEDDPMRLHLRTARCISIHVLRVEDDGGSCWSRPPTNYFNPRPPCGGRRASAVDILTTALFQSTSSVWRTTAARRAHGPWRGISIHVLRVEDDPARPRSGRAQCHFNPRPPCGGRPSSSACTTTGCGFQSTSSVWRTTLCPALPGGARLISIHVLRVEDDPRPRDGGEARVYFNPRPPCGGRRPAPEMEARPAYISIHVLRVEDDRGPDREAGVAEDFNPRPPCGGRRNTKTRKEDTR